MEIDGSEVLNINNMEKKEDSLEARFVNNVAEIPECRPMSEAEEEYKSRLEEENLWNPCEEEDHPCWENSMSFYIFSARAAIARTQMQLGVANYEATENASTGYAIQYAHDEFYRSGFDAWNAIERIENNKEILEKTLKRWSIHDIELFLQGLDNLGKKFHKIQQAILPHKSTKDLIEFYYEWKWSKETKDLRIRYGNLAKTGSRLPSIMRMCNKLTSSRMMTRRSSGSSTSSNEEKAQISNMLLHSLIKPRKRRLK